MSNVRKFYWKESDACNWSHLNDIAGRAKLGIIFVIEE